MLLVISGIGPTDRATWWLEVAPVVVGIPLLLWLRPRFPFTPLLYRLLFIHACIVMLGGHYTYAQVPLGDWVRDWFDLSRNNYDRLGHLAQGFIPAILMRELAVAHIGAARQPLAALPDGLLLPRLQRASSK